MASCRFQVLLQGLNPRLPKDENNYLKFVEDKVYGYHSYNAFFGGDGLLMPCVMFWAKCFCGISSRFNAKFGIWPAASTFQTGLRHSPLPYTHGMVQFLNTWHHLAIASHAAPHWVVFDHPK